MIDIDKIEAAAKAAPPGRWLAREWEEFFSKATPATVLEMVSMIRERDVVLQQALSALERTEAHLRIEVNEAYGRDAHVSTVTEWQEKLAHHKGTIAAIRKVLEL